MRTVLALFASLAIVSTSMAAIEMSDDQATYAGDGTSAAAMASNSDDNGGLTIGNAMDDIASSQSMDGSSIGSGVSGSIRTPRTDGFSPGGGGGVANNGGTNDVDNSASGNSDPLAAGAAPNGGATSGSGSTGATGGGGTTGAAGGAVPEPSTIVVWSLLAALGLGLVRTLRR